MGRLPTRNDPIHGHIPINHVYRELLPLQSVRQLKDKRQLGLVTEIYDAAEHSRYVHSRGTGWVARKMGENVGLPEKELDYLQAAGLLHDITHYPFSHSPERAIPISHDEAMSYVMSGRDFGDINAQEIFEALQRLGLDPARILRILQGSDPLLSQFITNKVVDADKLDYIPRDLHMGKLGMIETDYIINELDIRNGRLGICNGAATNLTQLISGRGHGFQRMYAHHKVHAGETQLVYALRHHPPFEALRHADREEQYNACSRLHSLGERQLLRELAESEDPRTAQMGRLLLGDAEGWYKAVTWIGHDSNAAKLDVLVGQEASIRAECEEQGMLCSGYQAARALSTRKEPLPYFPVWTGGREESFLEREGEARAAYQRIPGYAFVIYAKENTDTSKKQAEQMIEKYLKAA